MQDLSTLSDDELFKIAGVNPPVKKLESLSDEELANIAGIKLPAMAALPEKALKQEFTRQGLEYPKSEPFIKKSPLELMSDDELAKIAGIELPKYTGTELLKPKIQNVQGYPDLTKPKAQPYDITQGELGGTPLGSRMIPREVPRITAGLLRGGLGTIEGMAGSAQWLTNGIIGKDLANKAKKWSSNLTPENVTFRDEVYSGFGSMATFFIPGMGVAKSSTLLARVAPSLATYFGVGASTALEAITEAGSSYRQTLEETKDIKRAESAANLTFWTNIPLIAITNKLGVFGESGGKLKKMLFSAGMEATQEAVQEVISDLSQGKDISPQNISTAAAVGGITGGGMSILSNIGISPQAPTPVPKAEATPQNLIPVSDKEYIDKVFTEIKTAKTYDELKAIDKKLSGNLDMLLKSKDNRIHELFHAFSDKQRTIQTPVEKGQAEIIVKVPMPEVKPDIQTVIESAGAIYGGIEKTGYVTYTEPTSTSTTSRKVEEITSNPDIIKQDMERMKLEGEKPIIKRDSLEEQDILAEARRQRGLREAREAKLKAMPDKELAKIAGVELKPEAKIEEPLIEEAKKYKTVEEFVNKYNISKKDIEGIQNNKNSWVNMAEKMIQDSKTISNWKTKNIKDSLSVYYDELNKKEIDSNSDILKNKIFINQLAGDIVEINKNEYYKSKPDFYKKINTDLEWEKTNINNSRVKARSVFENNVKNIINKKLTNIWNEVHKGGQPAFKAKEPEGIKTKLWRGGELSGTEDIVYFSSDKNFAKEFTGDIGKLKQYDVEIKKPYVFDGGYKYENGKEAIDSDNEPITIGYLDAHPEIVQDIIKRGFDGAVEGDNEFVVSFKNIINKGAQYDKENIAGIPSGERVGEAVKQAGPVKGTGKEEVKTGGILQEEKSLTQEVKRISEIKEPAAGSLAYGQKLPKYAVNINLERVENTYDIKKMILDVSDQYRGEIDEARRGEITLEETKKLADELGMTEKDLLKRRKGQSFNAEQAVAARNILNQSAQDLKGLQSEVVKNPTDENMVRFKLVLQKHAAIQEEISGLTAEAGRALSSFRIKSVAERTTQNYKTMLDALGGRELNDEILKKFSVIDPDNITAINKFIREVVKAKTSDMVFEIWMNAILSNPKTHISNIISNALTALTGPIETAIEASLEAGKQIITGKPRAYYFKEVPTEVFGMWQGIKEGTRVAIKSYTTEMRGLETKLDIKSLPAVPSKEIKIMGKTFEIGGKQVRIPTRALMAADEFFKAIVYRAEINRLAYRIAMQENLKGEIKINRIAELISNPTVAMITKAHYESLYRTFNKPLGKIGNKIMALRDSHPIFKYIVPFLRTPINIAKFSLERTPLNIPRIIYKEFKGEFKGQNISDEIAKIILGSLILALTVELSKEKMITGAGPKERTKRDTLYRTGWQPYSFKIGDKYYVYNRLEPLGSLFGMSADFAELIKDKESALNEKALQLIFSVSKNVLSKTFMQGLNNTLDAISDPERYGEKWINQFAGSLVPSIVGAVATAKDETLRKTETPLDVMKSRTPFMSDKLIPKRDIWGREIKRTGSSLERFLLPINISPVKDDIIDNEMVRLMETVDLRIGMPSRVLGENKLTDEQYDKYIKISGENARKTLEKIIVKNNIGYNRLSDEDKVKIIKEIIDKNREIARLMLGYYKGIKLKK